VPPAPVSPRLITSFERGNSAVEFAGLVEDALQPNRSIGPDDGGQARLSMKRLADG
jgi:hypothetical protein